MASKHIYSKVIATTLLGAAFLPIMQDAQATFVGDEVIVTWDIAGSVASDTYTAVGDPRAILNYPDDFSPTTAPIDGAHSYVLMPDGSVDVVFNLGIFNVTAPIDVTLTVSDIDWLDTVPMEIVGVSDVSLWDDPTSITTGADFFSLYFAVTSDSLNDWGDYYNYGSLNLVFEPSCEPIPEPATLTLMGIGLGCLAFTRKRPKRKS